MAKKNDPLKWMLGGNPPEAAVFAEVDPSEIEEGRAYDEHGNVRPADARYTDDPAVVARAQRDGTVPTAGSDDPDGTPAHPPIKDAPLVKETVQKGGAIKPPEPVPAPLLGTNPTAN